MVKKRTFNQMVTCIIPAYNEESRISKVLIPIINHPFIDEVIVVDDGSTDKTMDILKKFKKIRLIRNNKNLGKTFSVFRGIRASRNNIIFLLDADLINLNRENISRLIFPVVNKDAEVTIALLGNIAAFRIIGADSGSGQRVFHKNILKSGMLDRLERYGLESYINQIIISHKLSLKIVDWKNVGCTSKGEKASSNFPVWAYVSMWIQMIKTVGLLGFFLQSFQLAKLNLKNE